MTTRYLKVLGFLILVLLAFLLYRTNSGGRERKRDGLASPIAPAEYRVQSSRTFVPLHSTSIEGSLLQEALQERTETSVLQTVEQLSKLGTAAVIHNLAQILKSLPPGDLREEAVRIASTVDNSEAVPAVLVLLQSTDDAGIIRMSQEIFARLAGPESIQSMLDIYDASTDAELRDRLERTVAYISTEEAVTVLKFVVSDTTSPATDGMIIASAQALRQIGTAPAVDALIERLNIEQNEEGRSAIAIQIADVRNPVAETSLQTAAMGQSKFATQPQTRITAIGTLLNYPSAETQELLAFLASDATPGVGEAAAGVLGEIQRRLATK